MSGEHRNERQSLDTVERVARAVEPTAAVWLARAHSRHDQLTKPPGSLGRLEALGARLCAIQKTLSPTVERCRVVVFAGDHGVAAAHAVSPYPCAVTAQMVGNFAAGGAAINALAGAIGVEVEVIDIGVASPLPAVAQASADAAPDPSGRARVIHARVAAGTADFAATPAMTHSQLAAALAVGIGRAEAASREGIDVLALGEMGIGNSTSAAALTAAVSGREPEAVVGPGTGANGEMMARKAAVVRRALAAHALRDAQPLEILRCVGGLELAGLCGLCLGAAAQRIAVISDGYIATAAATVAALAWPAVRGYLFAGHRSAEPGHRALLERLELQPLVDLQLRLGEGTGATLAVPLLRAAAAAIANMATFDQAGVSESSADLDAPHAAQAVGGSAGEGE